MSTVMKGLVICLSLLTLMRIVHSDVEEREPIPLNKGEFATRVESGETFIVNFVTAGCVKCNEFASEYKDVARFLGSSLDNHANTKVYIEDNLQTIRKQGLRRLPSIYYVREKKPILYTGAMNLDSIIDWISGVDNLGHRLLTTLTDDTFEHLTQAATGSTTGDWLILFCEAKDDNCSILMPMWESIAFRLHSVTNVAYLDVEDNPMTAKRFKISSTPAIHLFRNGKHYVYTLSPLDDGAIITFTKNGYHQFTGIDVVPEQSPFDTLTENIADQLKEVLPESHSSKLLLIGLPVIIIILFLIITLRFRSGATPGRTKKGV